MKTMFKILVEKEQKDDIMGTSPLKKNEMKIFRPFLAVVFLCFSAFCAQAQNTAFDGDFFASFQGATGINVSVFKKIAGGGSVLVPGNFLDFGTLQEVNIPGPNPNTTEFVLFLPGTTMGSTEYFYVVIRPIPTGSMAEKIDISFHYENGANPNNGSGWGGHGGLGLRASVFFRKKIMFYSPDVPCYDPAIGSEVPLFSTPDFAPNVRRTLQSISETGISLTNFCHEMKMYLIINDLHPDNNWESLPTQPAEVFSPGDNPGVYSGYLTITATVL